MPVYMPAGDIQPRERLVSLRPRDWLAAASSAPGTVGNGVCGCGQVTRYRNHRATVWGNRLPGAEQRSRFWGWVVVPQEVGILPAARVPRCGRWGAVWDREWALPKGIFEGRERTGNPRLARLGKGFLGAWELEKHLGEPSAGWLPADRWSCRGEELRASYQLRSSRRPVACSPLPCGCFFPSCRVTFRRAGKLLAERPSHGNIKMWTSLWTRPQPSFSLVCCCLAGGAPLLSDFA